MAVQIEVSDPTQADPLAPVPVTPSEGAPAESTESPLPKAPETPAEPQAPTDPQDGEEGSVNDETTPYTPATDVASALAEKGLDYNAMLDEMDADGRLSPETYAKLQKAGWPPVVVDAFIAGEAAKYSLWADHIIDTFGGQEAYDAMVDFAVAAYTPQEAKALDYALNSGDPVLAKTAIDALAFRYGTANPPDGYSFEGSTSDAPVVQGYSTKAELYAAMEDPRYTGGDPSFIEQHNRRLLKTSFI